MVSVTGSAWSSNLTPDNLGKDNRPSSVSIEQAQDYNLQVLKWDGAIWDTIGGDASGIVAAGSVFEPAIEKIDGTLYLNYKIDDTFYIKHLNGTTWDTDLEWYQEWLGNVELAGQPTVLQSKKYSK